LIKLSFQNLEMLQSFER